MAHLRRLIVLTAAAALTCALGGAPPVVAGVPAGPAGWMQGGGDEVSMSNVVTREGVTRLSDVAAHPALARAAGGYGIEILAAHKLSVPTRVVATALDATLPPGTAVAVDVRGMQPSGRWTQWQPTITSTADLGVPVTIVQARLTLTARGGSSPLVRSLRLSPVGVSGPDAARPGMQSALAATTPAALTATVYATREGLVGGRTANGHIITPEDHFVALPSQTALSSNGGHEYQVRVCNGATCVVAPVWDIGPWNEHDNYWNASRAEFFDLPVGTPEATAAYNTGYNNRRDDSGRTVANPAGIDLADGVFHDLGLTNNGNVTVTYLWTGSSFVVGGAIGVKYNQLGGAAGFLGAPITDELTTPNSPWGVGRYNHFQNNGSIYWTAATGAHEVHGLIRSEWAAIGWEQKLGFPTTDEAATPDGIGRYNHFQIGSIYWTPATGAHEVQGLIRDKWASLGWEAGTLGYPTSDELTIASGKRSNFQYGYIIWKTATNTTTAYHANGTPINQ